MTKRTQVAAMLLIGATIGVTVPRLATIDPVGLALIAGWALAAVLSVILAGRRI